jgi:hypothetical protein
LSSTGNFAQLHRTAGQCGAAAWPLAARAQQIGDAGDWGSSAVGPPFQWRNSSARFAKE